MTYVNITFGGITFVEGKYKIKIEYRFVSCASSYLSHDILFPHKVHTNKTGIAKTFPKIQTIKLNSSLFPMVLSAYLLVCWMNGACLDGSIWVQIITYD